MTRDDEKSLRKITLKTMPRTRRSLSASLNFDISLSRDSCLSSFRFLLSCILHNTPTAARPRKKKIATLFAKSINFFIFVLLPFFPICRHRWLPIRFSVSFRRACALCYAYECMNVLNKSTFFLCVFNLRPRIDLCVFSSISTTLHLKSICVPCLFKARKINIKRKKTFFPYVFFALLFLSRPHSWISLCAISLTEYLGYNQDVKYPLFFKGGKWKLRSFKLLCLFFPLFFFLYFPRFFFPLFDPLTATTKLETLSELFDLERFWNFFQYFFASLFFAFNHRENYWIINNTKKTTFTLIFHFLFFFFSFFYFASLQKLV